MAKNVGLLKLLRTVWNFVEAREKTSQNANAEARGSMESMGDAAYEDIPF